MKDAQSRHEWILFAASIGYGLVVFQGGFRLTSEVVPVLGVLMLGSMIFGFVWPHRAWLRGLGVGIATLVPEPPLSPEHIQRERPSRPLPLPFGLTTSPFAQWAAGAVLIMAFPFIAAVVGWTLRRLSRYVLPPS